MEDFKIEDLDDDGGKYVIGYIILAVVMCVIGTIIICYKFG